MGKDDYIILAEHDTGVLAEMVNEAMVTDGYIPFGQPFMAYRGICQAMMRPTQSHVCHECGREVR